MTYLPIENHGMVGDMHTVALVGIDGSIDWMCIPHFDSPGVFSALLDDKKGGYFRISPRSNHVTCKQFYWPDTNVLVTRFLSPQGAAELTDFMPVEEGELAPDEHRRRRLIRRVTAMRGSIELQMECRPAFNFARDDHQLEIVDGGAVFSSKDLVLGLDTDVPLEADGNHLIGNFE